MKKVTLIALCLGGVALLAGGGFGIYKFMRSGADPVEVTPVSYLNSGWWGNEGMATYGMITANASQNVNVQGEMLIHEVFVKAGDKVRIGDKLLSYDTTLLELNFESEKLSKKTLELQLQGLEKDLEKLKKIIPVSDAKAPATLVSNDWEMLAAPEDGTESETNTEKETEQTDPVAPPQDTEGETGQETESEEESMNSPLDKIVAKKKLNYKSKPYKGSGTKEDPYIFFCMDGATVEASFMNKMLGYNEAGTSKKDGGVNGDGKGCYAILEIREGDSVSGGFVKSIHINGTSKSDKAYAPGITWTFTSEGMVKNELNVSEPPDKGDGDDDWNFGDDDSWGDGDDIYTASELKDAINEKENEIKEAKLDIKEAELNVKKAERKMDEATVKATINGVVKAVGDKEVGQVDDDPFLSITSDEGLYVTGTISELKLGSVQVGSVVTGMSMESNINFTATITEISEYPDSSGNFFGGGDGNTNVSNYPFLAYIEDSSNLNTNESVQLNIQTDGEAVSTSTIYLEKMYVRSEGNQSYVFIADEDKKLKKQYIKTGKTLYSSVIEIKDGLKEEDKIAFPYGKNVKEGMKTKAVDEEDAESSMGDGMEGAG